MMRADTGTSMVLPCEMTSGPLFSRLATTAQTVRNGLLYLTAFIE
jgi:hypothetical protein